MVAVAMKNQQRRVRKCGAMHVWAALCNHWVIGASCANQSGHIWSLEWVVSTQDFCKVYNGVLQHSTSHQRRVFHNAIQRSIRQGNILMICKDCGAKCRASTYKNDAWCVTTRNDAVGRQCQKSADATTKKCQDAGKTPGRQREKSADAPNKHQEKSQQKQDAGKVTEATRTGMLLLGGVWWCTCDGVSSKK